ncbi:helix-turn-helix domain-containing protein [Kitasatospora sp. NPDC057223]|uniref:helix-turn-helix domain-containing protein n=1 Tax=Kitasatospora sp. NPDC057223 TaxID=3346055 RepID=UPI00363C0FED
MGRRESAVAAETRQMEALALWLREQRQRAGLTYAAMAQSTKYDPTTLSRAGKGTTLPSQQVVEAFAGACDADLTQARHLWRAAHRADQKRRKNHQPAHHGEDFHDLAILVDRYTVHPELIEDFPQLRRALRELRAKHGQPSLRELEKRAGRRDDGGPILPKSTLGEILNGRKRPDRSHVLAFATAMGASNTMVQTWGRAWDRAGRNSAAEAAHAPLRLRLLPGHPDAGPATGALPDPWGFDRLPPAPPGPGPAPAAGDRSRWSRDTRTIAQTWGDDNPVVRDVNYLLKHGLLVMAPGIGAQRPLDPAGPRRPHPPAGHTLSGLPIRVPRRYERTRRRRPAVAAAAVATRYDPFTWGRAPQAEPPRVHVTINLPARHTELSGDRVEQGGW